MGCVRSIFLRKRNTASKCIQQLNEIDAILKEMLRKYTRQKEQLEDEIKANGWLIADGDAGIVFDSAIDAKWDHALESMGVSASNLSSEGGRA